jgi:hypothetical protein
MEISAVTEPVAGSVCTHFFRPGPTRRQFLQVGDLPIRAGSPTCPGKPPTSLAAARRLLDAWLARSDNQVAP